MADSACPGRSRPCQSPNRREIPVGRPVSPGWYGRCSDADVADASLPAAPLKTALALGFHRLGLDTRAARAVRLVRSLPADLFADLPRPGSGDPWFDAVFAVLAVPPDQWAGRRLAGLDRAATALARAAATDQIPVSVFDAGYPALLAQIPDPPVVLWRQGRLGALDAPAVALVGSRNATPTGVTNARRLAQDLARSGLVVTSGLARGIDAAAHHGALAGGGPTVAVLGSGLDRIYPREHASLAAEIVAAGGALVSEFPPGTPPLPSHFPLRNRLISGLARAVVIVEASARSGSLITARAAAEQGRDVLAVPGGVASGCYGGCHGLIKDGARLVETVDDILDEVGWCGRPDAVHESHGTSPKNSALMALMPAGEAWTLDDLADRTGRAASELLAELGTAEVAGQVARLPGGCFVRLD
jgi:DNA processing protein